MHIGQLVICVDDSLIIPREAFGSDRPHNDLDGLRKGEIYTVRDIGNPSWWDRSPTIKLEEIVRPTVKINGIIIGDWPYLARRFRPVNPKLISEIQKMVKDIFQKQPELA